MVLFSYNYMSYYTKTFAMFIFICSLCFYLYILQCNGGFDLQMYIPLYLFSVHLPYNHCILIRYSYYIIVTYVDIIVVYIFFFFVFVDGLTSISFHSIEQFSCRQLYTIILYLS